MTGVSVCLKVHGVLFDFKYEEAVEEELRPRRRGARQAYCKAHACARGPALLTCARGCAAITATRSRDHSKPASFQRPPPCRPGSAAVPTQWAPSPQPPAVAATMLTADPGGEGRLGQLLCCWVAASCTCLSSSAHCSSSAAFRLRSASFSRARCSASSPSPAPPSSARP